MMIHKCIPIMTLLPIQEIANVKMTIKIKILMSIPIKTILIKIKLKDIK